MTTRDALKLKPGDRVVVKLGRDFVRHYGIDAGEVYTVKGVGPNEFGETLVTALRNEHDVNGRDFRPRDIKREEAA